ncbi:hypothetical protein KRR38_13045 [Novosphingobium sp. G106]|uniref:hypothetical protein n=1 Tax=Novosphingobium sp. G106 TaxID=2849500 RepID=UPI001C2D8065|nr:hypothetical protein [Novosphingobium sp. G106]MBV1688577.1 hypothetical protein [Novosphingobium sp. G106]
MIITSVLLPRSFRGFEGREHVFQIVDSIWAKLSVEGLGKLKALSPVDADGALRK